MLRHLILSSLENYAQLQKIPLMVSLKDFTDAQNDLMEFCYQEFCAITPVEKDQFNDLVCRGMIFFLFDAYDEIKNRFVKRFDSQLEKLISNFPDNKYIQTSRPVSSLMHLNEFTVYHLCPLTREKVINLVKRLQDLSDDFVMKESLLEKFQNGQPFSSQEDFIGNPLLLTILLVSYKHFSEIPSTMSRIYQNTYDALSW